MNKLQVYQLALAWVEKDDIGRRSHVNEICSKIRIPFMTDYGLQVIFSVLTRQPELYHLSLRF